MISSVVKAAIFLDMRVKMSMKDIARRYFVSPAFCWKILDQIPLKQSLRQLPEALCFDEFKTTQNSDNGLAFVYSDGITHELLDILESRKIKGQDDCHGYEVIGRINLHFFCLPSCQLKFDLSIESFSFR